ncbi:hypothetical protein AJ80_08669 [Polytolypa hystricis UAMH7299]|uniref:Probable E3 ubiquitin ligase complex SCF subunit sconB n=1 Tax=Polytolypa hystricis (strain UAMH7299) TaxID=1447883 RepID=A0A2B7X3A6_POLH7|nr:hypothetical protein AJ80_08669 [Polytolypa hystricis UAMH7299]
MLKRNRDATLAEAPPAKRTRPNQLDLLSSLSDEVILHILSFLPITSLSICQRISHRFHVLAGDSALWKRKYYSRWVWPRFRRAQHLRESGLLANGVNFGQRSSKWVGHEHLIENPQRTNWKKQYRLRHNWSKGLCRLTEVEVAQPLIPTVLVKLYKSVAFTADSSHGLRAWSTKDMKVCLASIALHPVTNADSEPAIPTAIAVGPYSITPNLFELAIGYETGDISLYTFNPSTWRFSHHLSYSATSYGAISALAFSSGYILALSQNQTLSLFRLSSNLESQSGESTLAPLQLITSLKASNILAPLSLSIRTSSSDVIAAVAYSFSQIGCGWSIGLQELRLNQQGDILGSRLATTIDSQFTEGPFNTLSDTEHLFKSHSTSARPKAKGAVTAFLTPSLSYTRPPTSLSYSHPYLLASHADNTLTMYLVVSTSRSLTIKTGGRLWGHTSSVSGVQVSDRGKAVSVSAQGDDIRIWELEDVVSTHRTSRRPRQSESSVQVNPENIKTQQTLSKLDKRGQMRNDDAKFIFEDVSHTLAKIRGVVGFDDEQVVVLREHDLGSQLLDCYDFT